MYILIQLWNYHCYYYLEFIVPNISAIFGKTTQCSLQPHFCTMKTFKSTYIYIFLFHTEEPRGQKRKRDGEDGDEDWNFPTTLLHLFILTCRVIKYVQHTFISSFFFLCFAFPTEHIWIAKHKKKSHNDWDQMKEVSNT